MGAGREGGAVRPLQGSRGARSGGGGGEGKLC